MTLSYEEFMEQGIGPQCSKREQLGRMCKFDCYYNNCRAKCFG